jgi:aryl-alcohol dehydrogenase-like predicted oxidoreductase
MRYRRFADTDLHVSEIGLGCAALGGTAVQRSGRRQAVRLLHEACDRGINFYDTADSYGNGRSEELLGRAFQGRRDHVVLASKTGYAFPTAAGLLRRARLFVRPLLVSVPGLKGALRKARASQRGQDFSPEHLVRSVEQSLRRLRTDRLDLLQLHNPPLSVVESGEAIDTLEALKAAGKVRFYGISCRTVEDGISCLKNGQISSLQVPINLVEQSARHSLLPLAQRRRLAVIGRQPLASGFLAQPAENLRPDLAVIDEEQFHRKLREVTDFQFLHDGRRSIAQAALRFVMQLEGVSVTLVGTSNVQHLRENLEVLTIPPLTPEEMGELFERDGSSPSAMKSGAGRF